MMSDWDGLAELRLADNGVRWLAVPGWERFEWLCAGFSTRQGGVSYVYSPDGGDGELNLGFTAADQRDLVGENRLRFVEAISGSRATQLITVRQIHSNLITCFDGSWPVGDTGTVPETDGVITNKIGVVVGIQMADCVPVLLVDPVERVIAAIHAGWRGTAAGIVGRGVARMEEVYGCESVNLLAAIGPGIGGCCYTVGQEVRGRFDEGFSYSAELFRLSGETGEVRLDLIEANRRQLLASGLQAGAISVVGGCTACHPKWFYSHRASGGHAGRMMAVIEIR